MDQRQRHFIAGDNAGLFSPLCPCPANKGQIWLTQRPQHQDPRWNQRHHDPSYEAGRDSDLPRQEPLPQLVAVLDDLRSQANVGAIFRTVDCAGWGGLHLCGITAIPPSRGVLRASLGSENYVRWHYHSCVLEALALWVDRGYTPVALECTSDACLLEDFEPPAKLALVVGNERSGISREVLQLCPRRVAIPLTGRKASLNSAVAFGVAAFSIRQRWLRLHRPGGADQ